MLIFLSMIALYLLIGAGVTTIVSSLEKKRKRCLIHNGEEFLILTCTYPFWLIVFLTYEPLIKLLDKFVKYLNSGDKK